MPWKQIKNWIKNKKTAVEVSPELGLVQGGTKCYTWQTHNDLIHPPNTLGEFKHQKSQTFLTWQEALHNAVRPCRDNFRYQVWVVCWCPCIRRQGSLKVLWVELACCLFWLIWGKTNSFITSASTFLEADVSKYFTSTSNIDMLS